MNNSTILVSAILVIFFFNLWREIFFGIVLWKFFFSRNFCVRHFVHLLCFGFFLFWILRKICNCVLWTHFRILLRAFISFLGRYIEGGRTQVMENFKNFFWLSEFLLFHKHLVYNYSQYSTLYSTKGWGGTQTGLM